MKSPTLPAVVSLLALAACSQPNPSERTLSLIRDWVGGRYDNVAQAEADLRADLPPELIHRPMHQLFVPIDIPGIDGYVVYQQSSADGSENPELIFRHGLLLYLPRPEDGVVIQRELYFREHAERYKNLHRKPELWPGITLDALSWDENCDFHLTANAAGTLVSGPLPGRCALLNRGTGKNMYADDRVEITATEYRFRGRYRDEAGNIVWGTASNELNRLVRSAPPALGNESSTTR